MSRVDYYSYIRSDAWKARKIAYLKSELPKDCAVCDAPWNNAMHFHHQTYENLGCERLIDIVPVCAPCHELIHDVHRKHPHRGLWWALKGARALAHEQFRGMSADTPTEACTSRSDQLSSQAWPSSQTLSMNSSAES
jgi:hypothetical protein